MNVLRVGIDVSKDKFDVAALLQENEKTTDLGTFKNNSKGFEQIARELTKQAHKIGADNIRITLEPTGGYEYPLAAFACQKDWQVCMVNAYKVRKWAESQGRRGKTDTMDARVLAQYGLANEANLHWWKPLPQHLSGLDNLLKRQDDLQANLQMEKNRLHALESQDASDQPITESVRRHIKWLETELQTICEEIGRYLDEHPDLKEISANLRSVPGVGEKNCLYLLVLLSRWSFITDGKGEKSSLVAYVGLDPVPFSSGTSVHQREVISRKGSPAIRAKLYMSALGGIRGNNPLQNFYQHLLAEGKEKKVALVACARKVLIWSWAVFSGNTVFQPELACSKKH